MTQKHLVLPLIASLLTAQPATVPEKFEAASIKLIPPDRTGCTPTDQSLCFWASVWGGATYSARNTSLIYLVEIAYGVEDRQISGIDRLGNQRFDVSVKPPDGVLTYQRAQPMFRAMLEERFKLAAHRETKEVPGYALTIAKGGPKLESGDATTGRYPYILHGRLVGPNAAMAEIVSTLARPLGKPVIDKTNLTGTFNIDLKFAPDGDTNSTLPSIFTAVQEQLGLKLESQKVPFETLVIDHCERIPTEN